MPPSAPSRSGWMHASVLVPTLIALGIALLVGSLSIRRLALDHEEDLDKAFGFETSEMSFQIGERFKGYRQVLRGARALFAASEVVSREEWQRYVESLHLNADFPGIQGVGFAVQVNASQLAAHERGVRAEGFPDYLVTPSGPRPEYAPITYLEPFDWRNQRAFGYDMLSEPVRREAMYRARSLGLPALSGKVRLVQETGTDTQAGVLLYLPLFRNGARLDTSAAREKAFVGWIFSPFRMKDLIVGTLGEPSARIRIRIFDGKDATPDQLLFDSGDEKSGPGRFTRSASLELDGRTWSVQFDSTPDFETTRSSRNLEIAATTLICALFVMLTGSFAAARQRARELDRIGTSLRASEARYSTLVNLSRDGIAALDSGLAFTFVNPRLKELLGYPSGELLGRPLESLWPAQDKARAKALRKRLHLGQGTTYEQELQTAGEHRITTLITDAPHIDRNGALQGVILTITDITERKDAERRIQYLATHDPLTGLANRSMFLEHMEASLLMAQRQNTRFALLFLDLDRFKAVNDTLGHHAGDQLLIATARRIRQCLRASDQLARQGGDEFMALLHNVGSREEALRVSGKIRAAIEQPFTLEGGVGRVSISVGIAMYPEDGTDIETLTRHADAAMYAAKTRGRNSAVPDTGNSPRPDLKSS